MRNNWNLQLVRITNKGFDAALAGKPKDDNPYTTGHRNQNGNGGNLQTQRRRAWHEGWLLGISEATARCKHCGSFELRRDVASGAVDCVTCGERQNDD